jgi:membrane protein implicated in regulation of membrane protease activity
MLDTILHWLAHRPHRWHTVHIILITAILAVVEDRALMALISLVVLAVLALLGAASVRVSLGHLPHSLHPFDVVFLCLPGAFAFFMAAGALWVAVSLDLAWLGLPLFALHGALFVWIAADRFDRRSASNLSLTGR